MIVQFVNMKNLTEIFNKFGKQVIKQSRSNLTRGKKNVSKKLYDSLEYNLVEKEGKISIEFLMLDYGQFVDEGVNGKKKNVGSPNSFKSKMPPIQDIADWAKARNIRLRDDKGRFKKGDYKSIGYVIAKSIFENGIKPSFFFTKAFNKAFNNIEDDVLESLVEDFNDLSEDL